MRIAARKALRNVRDGELDNAPTYMRRFAAAMEHLYVTPPDNEAEDISDLELESLLDECESENPDCRVFFQVGHSLASIPPELMFANKSAETLYAYLAYKQMRDGRFEAFLDLASHEKPTLKILEVGAGTGSITRHLLGALQRFEKETGQSLFSSYTFTDISPSFFDAAQSQFGDSHNRLQFKTLDLERDPDEQGFEYGSYDLVIAGLVFHATANLTATLGRVRQLLKPGGHIAFQEAINPDSACANVTFGSIEGWWLSTENWRQHTPLLTAERWGDLLLETGFAGAELVLRDHQSDACHLCSMIVSKAVNAPHVRSKLNGIGNPHQNKVSLLIASDSDAQLALAENISEIYPNTEVLYLASVREGEWDAGDDIIVSLWEFGVSQLSALSELDFQTLQKLVQSVQNMLWVSSPPTIDELIAGAHSAVATGFLRAIQSEEPLKHIVTLVTELDSPATGAKYVSDLLDKCFFNEHPIPENEFVVRGGLLTIGRLKQELELDAKRLSRVEPQLRNETWNPGPSLALEVGTPGMLDTLRFVEDLAYQGGLASGEVEIEAVAWPISFRDVFVALGRLDMEGLGVECAGVVTRVGDACPYDLKPGDRAMMVSLGCMKSHPRASADAVVKIPDTLSFNDAVAAINPGMTAYHSLVNVARLQAGEKVLIHSGAGGTGQMAIGIAKWIGAEVYTTVGFDNKKQLLMNRFGIPEDHIFYSRNTSFAKGIMRATGGYGVDVVINSLSGQGLRASWECIAPYGRFVEIGKADIGANSSLPMGNFAKNIAFAHVDLVHICHTNSKLMRQLIEKVITLISGSDVGGPVPLHVYSLPDVEKAFRYMQSGTNTGRIIVEGHSGDAVPKFLVQKSAWQFDANASYVVAGGFGGIGRAILRWMADRGAKNLIALSSRGASSRAALDLVSDLEKCDVRVVTTPCDVASPTDLSALLRACAAYMPPVKGCINAAIFLQDSVFGNMTHTQWSRTIQSKVHTSWNLHQQLPADMDFFILLSSLGGIYGSPGQSNYAGGCTFQDALARSRTAAGYRGSVAINLGWMRTIGIIAETEEYRRNRRNSGDMSEVEEADFFALMDHYCDPSQPPLDVDHCQVLIGVFTQARLRTQGDAPMDILNRPLFAGFSAPHLSEADRNVTDGAVQEDPSALFRQTTTVRERSAVVVAALKAKLARALDISTEEIDTRRSLSDYGTDSLMAVELRNWIRRDFGISVAVFDIMGGADIASVGDLVAEKSDLNEKPS
ncbi:KR-domain-containing protein [Hypoxylon sp. NC1633]|nr:KR-domain-containing protein [Hypoxylon sp. NC1633]